MKKITDLWSWLGLRRQSEWALHPRVGYAFGFFITAIVLLLIIVVGALIIQLATLALKFESSNLRDIGWVLAGLVGIPFLTWRTIIAARQANISEDALLNDKFNAATEKLSARFEGDTYDPNNPSAEVTRYSVDDLVARLGAIGRLESLCAEQPSITPAVVKVLAGYIRGNFSAKSLDHTEPPFPTRTPRIDLQSAVDAIGRILGKAQELEPTEWRLDLRGCDFDGVNFGQGHFFAVNFTGSRFEGSNFTEANLEGARFTRCLINYASFRLANLKGANFDLCICNRPTPTAGGMNSIFAIANDMTGVSFFASDISAVDYLGSDKVVKNTIGSKDTKVSAALASSMPNEADWLNGFGYEASSKEPPEELKSTVERFRSSPFSSWVPYSSNDLAIGWSKKAFFQRLNMFKWPYLDLLNRFR